MLLRRASTLLAVIVFASGGLGAQIIRDSVPPPAAPLPKPAPAEPERNGRPVDPKTLAPGEYARWEQKDFEVFRHQNLPSASSRRGGCDEQVGRLCYWYDEHAVMPREPEPVRARRERTLRLGSWIGIGVLVLGALFVFLNGRDGNPTPTPTPTPTPAANDELDLNSVTVLLGPNLASWRATSTVTSVRQGNGELCIFHTMLGQWPTTAFFGDPSTQVEGNQWIFACLNALHLQSFDRASFVRGLAANGFEVVFHRSRHGDHFDGGILPARRNHRPLPRVPRARGAAVGRGRWVGDVEHLPNGVHRGRRSSR